MRDKGFTHVSDTKILMRSQTCLLYKQKMDIIMWNIRKGHAGSPVTNNFYSLNSIPYDIREIYLDKLYQTGHSDLIKYLENAEYNETDMWKMLRHIKRRDRLRSTNLLDVFPEWKKYYETCNG